MAECGLESGQRELGLSYEINPRFGLTFSQVQVGFDSAPTVLLRQCLVPVLNSTTGTCGCWGRNKCGAKFAGKVQCLVLYRKNRRKEESIAT